MKKQEFLRELERQLEGVAPAERKEMLYDYEEHIRFAVSNGTTEEEAVSSLGNPRTIARELMATASVQRAENATSRRSIMRQALALTGYIRGHLLATSSAGSVSVTYVKGDVDLESSAGSIEVSAIDGGIRAHSSAGSVAIHQQDITHNITATSSAGSVHITSANVPVALQFSLRASAGSVHFGLPKTHYSVNGRTDVEGSIGHGGPVLSAKSSVGGVDVSQAPIQ